MYKSAWLLISLLASINAALAQGDLSCTSGTANGTSTTTCRTADGHYSALTCTSHGDCSFESGATRARLCRYT